MVCLNLEFQTALGRENVNVADFMTNARGAGRSSMLSGKSTHNQRIEKLWRDVYDGVLSYFYDLFIS